MSGRRILVSPLNWGLGHATRCVPLIKKFQLEGSEIILSANGRAKNFLQMEFPELKFISSPDYNIRYSNILPLWLMIFIQSPAILFSILKEHKWLDEVIEEYKIDEVISDNRYGLWTKKIRCVFITHQLMIKCPSFLFFLEPILHRIVKRFVLRYTECWVPDYEGAENLSGDLSHKYPLCDNTKFIGPLSRFNDEERNNSEQPSSKILRADFLICFILSGPEPQRTRLEKKILKLSNLFRYNVLLIQGKTDENYEEYFGDHLRIVSNIKTNDLKYIITHTPLIICRAGYSGIMDLDALGKVGTLIPTPGQTEQEYLAKYLSQGDDYDVIRQSNFSYEFKKRSKMYHK